MTRLETIDLNPYYIDYKIILVDNRINTLSIDRVIHFTKDSDSDSAYSITNDGDVRLSSHRYPDLMINLKGYD